MKFLLLIIFLIPNFIFASDEADDRKVSELSIDELKQIVRMIVEESIEQCTVGTMEGRAKVNLKVEGEVVAKMSANLKLKNNVEKNFLNSFKLVGINFLERRRSFCIKNKVYFAH